MAFLLVSLYCETVVISGNRTLNLSVTCLLIRATCDLRIFFLNDVSHNPGAQRVDRDKMLSDSSDDEGGVQDVQFTINEHYAKAFEYRKEREELAKCTFVHPSPLSLIHPFFLPC